MSEFLVRWLLGLGGSVLFMLATLLARCTLGYILLGHLGVILAVATQFAGFVFLDWSLERRDQKRFEEEGGWLTVDEYAAQCAIERKKY